MLKSLDCWKKSKAKCWKLWIIGESSLDIDQRPSRSSLNIIFKPCYNPCYLSLL